MATVTGLVETSRDRRDAYDEIVRVMHADARSRMRRLTIHLEKDAVVLEAIEVPLRSPEV